MADNHVKEVYEKIFDSADAAQIHVETDLFGQYLYQYLNNKNEKILDVGCGYGRYSHSLISDLFSEVYGIDLFDTVPFKEQGFHYYKASMEALPFENDFFDIIFAQSVIYYSHDCRKTILEWNRVLKKSGLLLLSGHTKYSIYTLLRRIKRIFKLKSVEHLQGVKFYSTNYYKQLLIQNGFQIVKIDGWGMFFCDSIFRLIAVISRVFHFNFRDPRINVKIRDNTLWCRLKSIIGYHYIIVAKKDN